MPYLLDEAGGILPSGLQFLRPGWWLIHLLAFVFVFAFAYRRGRGAERRAQRIREMERDKQR